MEREFYLDIELSESLRGCISYILLCITLCYYHINQYVAASNHKHGFLCEVQGFLWSYMGFYVE